jgi:hypothetical protein
VNDVDPETSNYQGPIIRAGAGKYPAGEIPGEREGNDPGMDEEPSSCRHSSHAGRSPR